MKSLSILICLLISLLAIRFFLYYQNKTEIGSGEVITLKTTLLNEPKMVSSGQMIVVDDIFVFAPLFPKYYYGDHLSISGLVEAVHFGESKQTHLVIDKPEIIVSKNKWLAIPRAIRYKVQETFNNVLPADDSALLLGIIFGFRNNFSETYYDQLQVTGVLHVVAASGTNVTILAAVLLTSLAFFVKRKMAIIFTVCGIGFYAVIAGLDPPIVRASIMGLIALIASISGRLQYALLALIVTGFAMLCISPGLITNIGFQLSFLATLGLIVVKPRLDKIIGLSKRNKTNETDKAYTLQVPLAEDFSTTFSAQITTIPILVNSFGSYSPISVIVNVLVLWMIPILMVIGGLAATASLIWEPLALPFLYCCYPFLLFFKIVVQSTASIANATLLPKLNIFVIVGMYLVLLGLLVFRRHPLASLSVNKNRSENEK